MGGSLIQRLGVGIVLLSLPGCSSFYSLYYKKNDFIRNERMIEEKRIKKLIRPHNEGKDVSYFSLEYRF